MSVTMILDGRRVEVPDDGASLLEAIRDRAGERSPKDGCSPQGQCGCCTVLVDGQPRVACVTPVRRVANREVTTFRGLDPAVRDPLVAAFVDHGASQCGFCTPGIVVRLAAQPIDAGTALLAHLCRCTGWRTIIDAFELGPCHGERDLIAAGRRATLEGGTPQAVGPGVVGGDAGFAEDTAPSGALVAVPAATGGWAVAPTLVEARAKAGKVQGRRSTIDLTWPLEVPPGDWALTLRTTWVEPAYLEPDASWCVPGGTPSSCLANGGAFGGKVASPVGAAARALADEHGLPVRAVLAREDVVRLGPKRPPIAAGVRADGTGSVRVVATPGIAFAKGLTVEHVPVPGPPTSASIRGAGWVESEVLMAGLRNQMPVVVTSPSGGWASASVAAGAIDVVACGGEVLDEIVLRSYCIGAAHQALGWVTSEGIAVDAAGVPQDLTIRSFGILRARDMPAVSVRIAPPGTPAPGTEGDGPTDAVNASDAVFAAVAAAAWINEGRPPAWPTRPTRSSP